MLDISSGGPFRRHYRKSCIETICDAIMSKIVTVPLEVNFYCYPIVSG